MALYDLATQEVLGASAVSFEGSVFTFTPSALFEGRARLGVVATFEDYPSAVKLASVVLVVRHTPTVLTPKMYAGYEHILEIGYSEEAPASETVTILFNGEVVYSELPLDFLYENKGRATVQLESAGVYSVIYNFAEQYCSSLVNAQIGVVNVVQITEITPKIVSQYQETEFVLASSVRIPMVESDRIVLCDSNCVCESVYATGEIHQRNVAGSLIPEYYTTLQLSTAAPNSKLNVCYKMPTTTVNTGLLVDVLKIVSFELSVVPEGVTIRNIPLVGSGMTVGDKVLMVPDEAVCAGMEAMTLDVQFTRKYVAAKFEAPLLPEACTLAKMSVFYVPSSTNVPVDLALSFSVAKVSMSATVDSPYTMFGRKEMTFLVEGSTTIQQMVFFFKYTSGTDMTPYYCLTRPERAEGRIPIKCSFATVPKAGEMCMKFMFQSSSLTESVWEDIERPVDNGCYFVADYPNAHREGLQFETIAPMFSEDLSSVDVDYFRGLGTDAEVKVAVYTSSVDELTFLLAAETEEVTAVARFGDYYGPVDGVTVRVRGLKAITTTAPSILTTVMTPFTLSLVDPPAGSQVGFSASTACNEVMYINPMEAAIEVTFSRAYSHLYVCVNYGAGFRFSGLPFLTVLEFRNTLTVVANEETRVNYQYLTPTPSESCVLEPARDITVDNGCDWVSSIFVGETGLVVDGKVSTSMVFGANIAYNPTCQRPIERTNPVDGVRLWFVLPRAHDGDVPAGHRDGPALRAPGEQRRADDGRLAVDDGGGDRDREHEGGLVHAGHEPGGVGPLPASAHRGQHVDVHHPERGALHRHVVQRHVGGRAREVGETRERAGLQRGGLRVHDQGVHAHGPGEHPEGGHVRPVPLR